MGDAKSSPWVKRKKFDQCLAMSHCPVWGLLSLSSSPSSLSHHGHPGCPLVVPHCHAVLGQLSYPVIIVAVVPCCHPVHAYRYCYCCPAFSLSLLSLYSLFPVSTPQAAAHSSGSGCCSGCGWAILSRQVEVWVHWLRLGCCVMR